jgi:3-hydroxy-5-methyl-1-naphthoate 3-O-methyltransferase
MGMDREKLRAMASGFQSAKILLAANELGIFKLLAKRGLSADEVSGALGLDREGTEMLLGALVGLKLIERKRGKLYNTPEVYEHLGKDSDDSMSCIFSHMNHLYESWGNLDKVVKKGRPKIKAPSKLLSDKKANRAFICGMFEVGRPTAQMFVEEMDLSGVRKFADIGGGPGAYPITIGRKHPDMSFVLADYPNTVKVAREYVKKYGMSRRVKLAECAFFDVDELGIGGDFDMALLSQVLHAAPDEKAKGLLEKVFRILRPGGRVVINENALNDDRFSPPPPLVFAINMLVQNAGRTFTTGELKSWLKESGFRKINARRLHDRSVLVEGTKP